MKKNLIVIALVLITLLVGCKSENQATINGVFTGMKNEMVWIEELAPGQTIVLDSVKLKDKGNFSFKYEFKDENPVFIRLRIAQDFITLLVSPKEKINVETIINLSSNYTVTGSEGSNLVREISQALLTTNQVIEDNVLRYKSTTVESERREIDRHINRSLIDLRRRCIEFLVRNSKSLASIMVLYQTYPNGQSIFGEKNDHLYFSQIADSLSVAHPTSPHVKQLVDNIGEYRQRALRVADLINKSDNSLPEINLPDMYNNDKKLSDLLGKKSVLLVFWSASDPSGALINRELKDIYEKYKDKDFEIYQVSLDVNKSLWLQKILETNLPWINVRDGAGPARSIPARTYKVSVLPYNFVINKEGIPVYKNIWGDQLDKKIGEVTK